MFLYIGADVVLCIFNCQIISKRLCNSLIYLKKWNFLILVSLLSIKPRRNEPFELPATGPDKKLIFD